MTGENVYFWHFILLYVTLVKETVYTTLVRCFVGPNANLRCCIYGRPIFRKYDANARVDHDGIGNVCLLAVSCI